MGLMGSVDGLCPREADPLFMQSFLKSPARTSSSADFPERFARDLSVGWALWELGNQREVICGIVQLVLCDASA